MNPMLRQHIAENTGLPYDLDFLSRDAAVSLFEALCAKAKMDHNWVFTKFGSDWCVTYQYWGKDQQRSRQYLCTSFAETVLEAYVDYHGLEYHVIPVTIIDSARLEMQE